MIPTPARGPAVSVVRQLAADPEHGLQRDDSLDADLAALDAETTPAHESLAAAADAFNNSSMATPAAVDRSDGGVPVCYYCR